MAFIHDPSRQVVPRWRSFDETLRRGELLPATTEGSPVFTASDIEQQRLDWNNAKGLSFAADFVCAAFSLGIGDVAADAAGYVLEHPQSPSALRRVAASYLNPGWVPSETVEPVLGNPGETDGVLPGDHVHILAIHHSRERLKHYPRNAIEWCNLAFHYTSLGVRSKAHRAIASALQLAPFNRFVLRCASRFFLHVGDRDRAHAVLAHSPLVRSDPWILAAEIALADSLSRKTRRAKYAQRVLGSERFSPFHVSELASALATLEFKSGRSKLARSTIALSLRRPSENAVAQAAWIFRHIGGPHAFREEGLSPEATAWTAIQSGDWGRAQQSSLDWQVDQPFSSRPAIHGSFVAATLFEDFDSAREAASIGLRCNPDDPVLLNNLAFSLAMMGDLSKARRLVVRGEEVNSQSATTKVTRLATRGLIEFRDGSIEEGRRLYTEAILASRRQHDLERAALAMVYLAGEEVRARTAQSGEVVQNAIAYVDAVHTQWRDVLDTVLARVRAAQSRANSPV